MTKPPDDLMQWSKKDLVKELQRLQAIAREHATPLSDAAPTEDPSSPAIVGGTPYGRGDALLDVRGAVLMDTMDVALIDRDPTDPEPPSVLLAIGGRVNFDDRRSKVAYMFGPDGAAAIASELLGLAARAGGEYEEAFVADLKRRMEEMP